MSELPTWRWWVLSHWQGARAARHRFLYRAVDQAGRTIDFLLTGRRARAAALHFLENAIGQNGLPELTNIDKSFANTAGIVD